MCVVPISLPAVHVFHRIRYGPWTVWVDGLTSSNDEDEMPYYVDMETPYGFRSTTTAQRWQLNEWFTAIPLVWMETRYDCVVKRPDVRIPNSEASAIIFYLKSLSFWRKYVYVSWLPMTTSACKTGDAILITKQTRLSELIYIWRWNFPRNLN